MKLNSMPLVISCLSVSLFLCLSSMGEVVTLVDKQNREMSAEILDVAAGVVSIKRADGQRFKVPVNTFSLQTQQLIRSWGKKGVVDAKVRACSHLVEVETKLKGETNPDTLGAMAALGEALINSGRVGESIPILQKAVDSWGDNTRDWRAHQASNLLGFAKVMADKNDAEGAKLLRSGYDGIKNSRRSFRPAEADWVTYKAAKRVMQFLTANSASEASGFQNEFAEISAKVVAERPVLFPTIPFKTRESDHFIVSSSFTETSDFIRNAEKAWGFYSDILVGLEDLYEKGNFSPPYKLAETSAEEKEPFRFHFYLPDYATFAGMTEEVAAAMEDPSEGDKVVEYAQRYGNIEDPSNRFNISRIHDPDDYSDDDWNWGLNAITHQLSEVFIKSLTGRTRAAFWTYCGLAYCGENEVNGDMQRYYSSLDFDAGGLALGTQWFDALRGFLVQGRVINFDRMIDQSDARRVEDYGFIYAFVAMLLSEEKSKSLFSDLIVAQGMTGRNLDPAGVAEWFGYEDVEKMQKALEDFIQSPQFR